MSTCITETNSRYKTDIENGKGEMSVTAGRGGAGGKSGTLVMGNVHW